MYSAPCLLDTFPVPDSWPTLDPSSPRHLPTQTHAWLLAHTNLVPRRALKLFAVKSEQGISALAPFVTSGDRLYDLPNLYEPGDLVWDSPASLHQLAGQLARQPLPVQLNRLPADSPSIAALRRAFRGHGIVITRKAMPTPVIDLSSYGGNFDNWLTTRRRSDYRRYERRAGQHGPLQYELHRPSSDDELQALMSQLLYVESASWKTGMGTAITSAPVLEKFYAEFAQAAVREGILRIALLRINGQPVAMQLAGEWKQRFWLFKISHDEAFAECSPGQLLMQYTLRHAIESGLLAYEFMGIMDRWTELWTKDQQHYVQLHAFPFSTATIKMLTKHIARTARARLHRLLR